MTSPKFLSSLIFLDLGLPPKVAKYQKPLKKCKIVYDLIILCITHGSLSSFIKHYFTTVTQVYISGRILCKNIIQCTAKDNTVNCIALPILSQGAAKDNIGNAEACVIYSYINSAANQIYLEIQYLNLKSTHIH